LQLDVPVQLVSAVESGPFCEVLLGEEVVAEHGLPASDGEPPEDEAPSEPSVETDTAATEALPLLAVCVVLRMGQRVAMATALALRRTLAFPPRPPECH
jgi:hypothetical protein